jgi:hypothetical protein
VTTFGCEPVPVTDVDAGGCTVPNADGGSPVTYPLGCISTLPGCSVVSNYTSPVTCYCTAFGQSAEFQCPL